MEQRGLQYKVNITDRTLLRLKEYDPNAWHTLMFVVLSESNESLVQEINKLKNKDTVQELKIQDNGKN
tara:strand:+ start:778 stop:981 length:204 start_codon:yes stop_codon:yes gene_type:complete